jgi:hypothetical protein
MFREISRPDLGDKESDNEGREGGRNLTVKSKSSTIILGKDEGWDFESNPFASWTH